MTSDNIKRDNFGGGAHNRNTADRLPESFYRRAVNLDPVGGGKLQLRSGYEQVLSASTVRGALSLGDAVLLADGADLKEFSVATGSARTLRQIAGAGDFAGCVFNDTLHFCTANESLRYRQGAVSPWGVPTITAQPNVTLSAGGAIAAGTYAYAITHVDADGLEGGTGASQVFVSAGEQRAAFDLPAPLPGGRVRLYVGHINSTFLYLQHEQAAAGTAVIAVLHDGSATLETQFHTEPPQGHLVAAHKGWILIAVDNVIWSTVPLRPHLVRRSHGFFQFPKRITVMAPVEGGVFVVADQTYFLSPEGESLQQRAIDSAIAVAGSQVELPGKRVSWMTQYGPVIGGPDGSLQFITKDHYAPDITDFGRSALLERNGNQLLITTQRGIPQGNSLAASDYYDGEVTPP